jgi:myo-inositol-1(or 4)-monophosphatase
MPHFSPYTLSALRAAVAAGEIQRRLFGRVRHIDYKGRHDPVTEADRACEDAIVEILRGAFPGHAFLGEERGQRGDAADVWLIDPLDGTHNYAHAFPWFAVSIALRRGGQIVAGVVLNTVLGEVYAAERGGGAYAATVGDRSGDPARWVDPPPWRQISVSQIDRLDEATLATGFPPTVADTSTTGGRVVPPDGIATNRCLDWSKAPINLDHFTNLLLTTAKIRTIGSAALSLASVALGQIEGYWEIGPHAWDFAAGALLVEEAGGRVTDLRGRALDTAEGQLLATNGRIHDQVTAVLARGRSGLTA